MRLVVGGLALALVVVPLAGCRDEVLTDLSGGVAGQVCNPVTGRPAAGATITARFTDPATEKERTKDGEADENGFFRIAGLPVTTVDLHVVVADEFTSDIAGIEIPSLDDAQLTDPACRDLPDVPGTGGLDGRLCNRHTGEYVTEGTVTLLLPDSTPLTAPIDAEGIFHMDEIPAGIHVVYVQAPGFQKTYQVEIEEGKRAELEDSNIDCQPYDDLSTGMIVGNICAAEIAGEPGGPLAGARVYIVDDLGDGLVYEDETLPDGSFTIAGIPVPLPDDGTVTVRAEKGGFAFQWDNVVVSSIADNPLGTNLTANVDCQPLEPNDGRKYLVVQGTFDRIEQVLDRMGLNNVDLINGVPADPTQLWSVQAFGNYDELASYDAVFVNCGISEFDLVQPGGLPAAVKANLKRYIEEGGSLYVSDWAYDLVEQVWPDKINFLADDTKNSDAEHGEDGDYDVAVTEPGLEEYVGATDVNIGFNFGNFAIVSQVGSGVTTYLRGDIKYRVNGGVSTLPDTPVTVGFSDGLGRVIFTSFHQESDVDGTTEILDGPEDLVLRYLIFSL
jgi:hypothetical protein